MIINGYTCEPISENSSYGSMMLYVWCITNLDTLLSRKTYPKAWQTEQDVEHTKKVGADPVQ